VSCPAMQQRQLRDVGLAFGESRAGAQGCCANSNCSKDERNAQGPHAWRATRKERGMCDLQGVVYVVVKLCSCKYCDGE
jgi:hypothetical protein